MARQLIIWSIIFLLISCTKEDAEYNISNYTTGSVQDSILEGMNNKRKGVYIKELIANEFIDGIAEKRIDKMIKQGYLSHETLSDEVILLFHINANRTAENVAYGYRTTKELLNAWMNSPDHRNNILNEKLNKCGIAYGLDENQRKYYCVVFVGDN